MPPARAVPTDFDSKNVADVWSTLFWNLGPGFYGHKNRGRRILKSNMNPENRMDWFS